MGRTGTEGGNWLLDSCYIWREVLKNEMSQTSIQAVWDIVASVLVAHTGVEPVISALRGRRPGPLDECAMLLSTRSMIPCR